MTPEVKALVEAARRIEHGTAESQAWCDHMRPTRGCAVCDVRDALRALDAAEAARKGVSFVARGSARSVPASDGWRCVADGLYGRTVGDAELCVVEYPTRCEWTLLRDGIRADLGTARTLAEAKADAERAAGL